MFYARKPFDSISLSDRRFGGKLRPVVERHRARARFAARARGGRRPAAARRRCLNPRHPEYLRRAAGRHALGHRLDVPARPVVLAGNLADQSAGREPAPDFPRRHAVARVSRRRPARRSGRARPASRARRRRRPSAFAARSLAAARGSDLRRFRTTRSPRSCRVRACSRRTSSTTCRTSSRIAKA